MRRKQLTLQQKVFVVKNYYQITDMFEVRKSFHRSYSIQTPETILELFYKLVTQFELTGSVTQAVYYDGTESKKGKEEVVAKKEEEVEAPRRKRGRPPKVKLEEIVLEAEEESFEDEDNGAADDDDYEDHQEEQEDLSTIPESDELEQEEIFEAGEIVKHEDIGLEDEADPDYTEEGDGTEEVPKKKPRAKPGTIKKPRIECQICQRTYTEDFLRSHYLKHDREGCQYDCDKCDEVFDRYDGFRLHQESHIPVTGYKHKCATCKEAFVNKEKLALHMKVHAVLKSYICEWCGMIFKSQDSMKIHTRIHTGEKPLKCRECDESFAFYGALKSHMRKHTGGSYKCNYCDKTFVYKAERNVMKFYFRFTGIL